MTDDIQTVRDALEPFADPFKVAPARAALDRIEAVVEAARQAHGILQFHHGDADPYIRSACDLIWNALAALDSSEVTHR